MSLILDQLIELLDLETLDDNHYRGVAPNEGHQRIYGGQVIGQALVAASHTVDADRPAHSLHGYFLRPGALESPILYTVDRIRDGRSFATRRVTAIQRGRPIFIMSISFQVIESGMEHQADMPDVPGPESLENEQALRRRQASGIPELQRESFTRPRPIDVRPVDPYDFFHPEKRAPKQICWFRADGTLPDDAKLHKCVLAYASDWTLLDTCTFPHGLSFMLPNFQVASLDHAMWFHREFRADEWLLYVQDSPAAAGARGFNRGQFFRQDGTLVASVAQEGLIRLRDH